MNGPDSERPNLAADFAASAARFPDRPALRVDETDYSYAELAGHARSIANRLIEGANVASPFVGILAARSLPAFAGTLATLLAGKTYVPFHPRFPVARLVKILRRARPAALVVGPEALEVLRELLPQSDERLLVVLPDSCDARPWSRQFARHHFVHRTGSRAGSAGVALAPAAELAYLLFTSGSTGEPKGVGVSHANALAYLASIRERLDYDEHDRLSFSFDLTFDLSVHDLFCSWGAGACVVCISEKSQLAPAKFIRDERLTGWFSVPVTASRMLDLRMLRPNVFPDLRISLFCGEPLPVDVAEAWCRAAPNSLLENLYGPTEATIAFTAHRFTPLSPSLAHNGIVPIGRPLRGQRVCVIDPAGNRLAPGETGELCLAGSQVTRGYFEDPDRTREQFVRLPEDGETVWYRTGDRAFEGEDGELRYVGRVDHQVKIRGFRVELAEIEFVLREATGGAPVAAIAWPQGARGSDHVEAFVACETALDPESILERCRATLPGYMVPRSIRVLKTMPLNSNGKLDRKQLAAMLESEP